MIKLFALSFTLMLMGCSHTSIMSSAIPPTLASHCISEQARVSLAFEECVNEGLDEALR